MGKNLYKQSLEDKITTVQTLQENTTNKHTRDADTILCDILQNTNFQVTGLASEIFGIWQNSKDRQSVDRLFHTLSGLTLDEFCDICINELMY